MDHVPRGFGALRVQPIMRRKERSEARRAEADAATPERDAGAGKQSRRDARRPVPLDPSAPLVALVGRPNVGKSSLFNRLVGGRPALVEDMPGVTRDRRYGVCEWGPARFRVVDTGGL